MKETALQVVRKGRKFEQVVDGAWKVFLNEGFEGASVDDIARSANVSKATLYSYFPDKRLLFLEVARAECQRQANQAFSEIDFSCAVQEVLTQAATRMVYFFLSDFGQQMFRICVSECARFPELGKEFFASGPGLVQSRMAEFLGEATKRGEINVTDTMFAAAQFHELCKADLHTRVICGLQTQFTQAERDRVINGAVEMFMARYGV